MALTDLNHWIFDMDGTLTVAVHDFDQIRDTLGLPPGKPILESIAELEPEHAKRVNAELDALELEIAYQSTAQEGAVELLEQLSDSGKKMGILTRNGRQIADATLAAAGIDQFFTAIDIVSRDCCTPKPEPDGVHLLLDRWQASAGDSVMVGDYLFDLQAGHNAGTSTVHMDVNGKFDWPDLTTVGVSSLPQLSALLTGEIPQP